MSVSSVLVVCAGNICRSPMAEALLRVRVPWLVVRSAGLCALAGQPAEPHAIAVLGQRGIDLTAHRSRAVSAALCSESDLILVMERAQKTEIETRYPIMTGRVFPISAQGGDIVDPYNGGRHAFERAFAAIEAAIGAWCARFETLRAPGGAAPCRPPSAKTALREP